VEPFEMPGLFMLLRPQPQLTLTGPYGVKTKQPWIWPCLRSNHPSSRSMHTPPPLAGPPIDESPPDRDASCGCVCVLSPKFWSSCPQGSRFPVSRLSRWVGGFGMETDAISQFILTSLLYPVSA